MWATVSSQSCFCWLYRASLSLSAKNIINMILVLTILWCPRIASSLVLLNEDVCYDQCVLLAKLYEHLPCFILYSKAKFACYSRCFLTSYFCIPLQWKGHLFWVLVLKGLVGLHRTIQLQLLHITGWGIGLDYHDIERFALEMNKDHSVIFETAQSTAFQTLLLTARATPFFF